MKITVFLFTLLFFNTIFANDKSAIVLMYHRFEDQRFPSTSISSKNFQNQINYLKENNFNILPISDLLLFFNKNYDIPEKSVFITIDDGYKSFYEHAFPILKENKLWNLFENMNSINKYLPFGLKVQKIMPFFIMFKLLTFTGFIAYIMNQ